MAVSKTINMNYKTTLYFFTKIIAYIILSWTCQYNNDEYAFSKSLENGNNVNISINVRNHRLLAKYVYQNDVPSRGLQNKVSYSRDNYNLEKGKGNNNTFQQLKRGRSNNVDNYLKSYENRYSKKKGLSKLDCYCEKKVLDKIHDLYGVGEKLMNEKRSFKKFFIKKYGIGLFLFALIPALCFIFPILFGVENWWKGVLEFCDQTHASGESPSCTKYHKSKWEPIVEYIYPTLQCPRSHAEEMKFKLGRTLNIPFNRLLAKHMPKNDLYKTHVRQNYADYGIDKNIKNGAEKKSTYSQVKGESLNKLDAYKKGYKHRHSKKKGLAKFECYCEKKIFDKIEYINCLGEEKKSGKISITKQILNKYTIIFFLFALLPFLGLLIPKLCDNDGPVKNVFNVILGDCTKPKPRPNENECKYGHFHIPHSASMAILCLNYIISYAFLAVSIILIIYTFIKIIKYEKLKAGKGKISAKEYVSFCKDVFLGK